jgi:site-specific recombinase XerD
MLIEVAIKNFMSAHKVENGSPATLHNLRFALFPFAAWLKATHGIVDTDDLRLEHLREWVVYMQETPSSSGDLRLDSTVHNYAVNLKAFCHWLENEEVLAKPITPRFKLPKVEQKFIPTFTPDDVTKLFAACDEGEIRYSNQPHIRKALSARNRAIVAVFLDTGIRLKELASLRLVDIDRDMRVLIVHRKGNKWQQVPISWDGFKVLHEYLTKHRSHLAKLSGSTVMRKDDPVFLNEDGFAFTRAGIRGMFDRVKRRAGIEGKRVSPHQCRRYMATTQLANGRSPLDVQRQMGHTTLTMTNRYASLSVDQLRASHDQFSPLRAKSSDSGESSGSGYWEE